jgi:hypothetical protein
MGVPCPCCGHRALDPADSLCAVCAWDDRDPDGGWQGKPRHGLEEAQRSFARIGACDPALRELTRPPRPDEARPSWWHPFDAEAAVVAALIADAFADVRLDGGTTMEEAELIDDYASAARTATDPPPPGYREPCPWQDLTLAYLDRFAWGNFPFHEARGVRYHLPAIALHHLAGTTPGAFDSLLYTLSSGHQLASIHALLTPAQRHAVARFLAHLATANAYASHEAARALKTLWGTALDPAHLAHVLG